MTAVSSTPLASIPLVLREDAGPIVTLTLNRPGKFNALSGDLIAALQAELERLMEDRTARVVVLRGAGKAFCAGHDLGEMSAEPGLGACRTLFNRCAHMMTTLTRLPQPVIARVQGVATAAGCQLVAQCDLAVAADSARFATSGITVGLFCSTPMVAVTRNMPRKQAMEMLLTGEFIDADTARLYGLVNRVVPEAELDAAVAALAGTIAGRAPASIAVGKRLFYTQAEQGLEAAYALAADVMAVNMQRPDVRAGIEAFVAKRPMPEWDER